MSLPCMFRAEELGLASAAATHVSASGRTGGTTSPGFLDADKLARLGAHSTSTKPASRRRVAAIRLLALTECRCGEVLDRRWRNIGEDAINLSDSKTGPARGSLGAAARALIEAVPGPP